MISKIVLILCGLVAFFVSSDAQAKRVALIISNSRYQNVPILKNPSSDADLIASSLRSVGFHIVIVKSDLNKSKMDLALKSFGNEAQGAEVALIYYAGHGIEAGGQNYLIPTDAKLQRDRDLDIESIRLETAIGVAEAAQLRIIILDACRNNPFSQQMQRSVKTRSVFRGLAVVEPEGETLVVYAAKAGATAEDGVGQNSPFAEALAARLKQPGLEIGLLFRSVRDDVLRKTGRGQEPFTYGSLSGKPFFFVPGSAMAATEASLASLSTARKPPPNPELVLWQGAVTANSIGSYRDYIKRYPNGQFSRVAKENIQKLQIPVVKQNPVKMAAVAPNVNNSVIRLQSGSVPQRLIGNWGVATKSGIFAMDYGVGLKIRAGRVGESVAEIMYFMIVPQREPRVDCTSIAILRSVEDGKLTFDEKMESKGLACPGDKIITVEWIGNQPWFEWKRRKDNKITMRGLARPVK